MPKVHTGISFCVWHNLVIILRINNHKMSESVHRDLDVDPVL